MEFRRLGASGLKVPALSFGAGTFGGKGPLFGAWGDTDAREARRLVDICLEAGVTMFDSADVYSDGASEEVLGEAIRGRRDQVIVSTKASLPIGDGPNDAGSSRSRLINACDAALRRLGTDYIDLFQLHAFDAGTPIEEVLSTLDHLVRAGKVRYVGVSNFAGSQLMKSISIAKQYGYPRYVAHQVYYSLLGRDYEWELMPLGHDEGVGAVVWSPLGWGRLTGKVRRGQPLPAQSRLHETAEFGPPVPEERLYRVLDVLDEVHELDGIRDARPVEVEPQHALVSRAAVAPPGPDHARQHHRRTQVQHHVGRAPAGEVQTVDPVVDQVGGDRQEEDADPGLHEP